MHLRFSETVTCTLTMVFINRNFTAKFIPFFREKNKTVLAYPNCLTSQLKNNVMILVVSSLERLPIKTKNKLNNSSMGNLTEFQNNTVHSTDM